MRLALLLLLAACGNDAVIVEPDAAPPFTRGDAEAVWADAWCQYAERCAPDAFARVFPDGQAECRATVAADNCTRISCDALYPPELRGDLAACHDEVAALACGPMDAPDVCYEAF